MQADVLLPVLWFSLQIASLAFDGSSTCGPNNAECTNPTPRTGDDDASLSETNLLQTKLTWRNHTNEEPLSLVSGKAQADQPPSLHDDVHAGMFKTWAMKHAPPENNCSTCIKQWFVAADAAQYTNAVQQWACTLKSPPLLWCANVTMTAGCAQDWSWRCGHVPTPAPAWFDLYGGFAPSQPATCSSCLTQWNIVADASSNTASLKRWACDYLDFVPLLWCSKMGDQCKEEWSQSCLYKEIGEPGWHAGVPGAAWTRAEVLAVKAKLWRLFSVGEGDKIYWDLKGKNKETEKFSAERDLLRLAPKLVRLAFHDCHRYEGGLGGCDGCLQWDGMGDRFSAKLGKKGIWDAKHVVSANNGLIPTVELMEEIWTNPEFPDQTVTLNSSLKSRGISRADLWALAGIAAVEYGVWTNNAVCDDPMWEARYHGKEGLGFSSVPHCHHYDHLKSHADCKVVMPRRIRFFYGREDCGEDYKTDTKEIHVDAIEDGNTTAKFFESNFHFDGVDIVAIMGVHTMGRIHYENSLLRYNWVKNGDGLFNNQYYRNLAGKKVKRFVGDSCDTVGDATGKPAVVRWLTLVQNDNQEGGPYQFIKEIKTCPDACAKKDWATLDDKVPTCCTGQGKCKASCVDWVFGSPPFDYTIETMTGAEMGLYLDFKVGDSDFPTGCDGLKEFHSDRFKEDLKTFKWSGKMVDGKFVKGETECPKQKLRVPPTARKSLHEIVDEFAEDQDAWLLAFANTWEKMQSNGYAPYGVGKALKEGPDQLTNIRCPAQDARKPQNRFWVCYNVDGLGPPTMIRSIFHDRAIEESEDLSGDLLLTETSTKIVPANLRQVWQKTAAGNHWVNAGTHGVMAVGKHGSFEISKRRLVPRKGSRLLKRGLDVDANLGIMLGKGHKWVFLELQTSVIESVADTDNVFNKKSGKRARKQKGMSGKGHK